jgi:hypothetical protein
MQGRDDSWEFVDLDTEETVWNLRWFEDRLYTIVGKAIYRWTSQSTEKITNDIVDDGDFHSISLTTGELLIFGRKKIVKYDGAIWDEMNCDLPNNVGDRDVLGFFNDDVLSTGSAYLEDDE